MSWEFRWASELRVHGLPLPVELEAAGYLKRRLTGLMEPRQ